MTLPLIASAGVFGISTTGAIIGMFLSDIAKCIKWSYSYDTYHNVKTTGFILTSVSVLSMMPSALFCLGYIATVPSAQSR